MRQTALIHIILFLAALVTTVVCCVFVRRTIERTGGRSAKCSKCGYALAGLTDDTPCPECGTAEPWRVPPELVRVRVSNAGIAAFLVLQTALALGVPWLARSLHTPGAARKAWSRSEVSTIFPLCSCQYLGSSSCF